jgi:hypothetical protein
MRTINKIWLAIIVFYGVLFSALAFYDEQPSNEMLENLARPLPEVIEPGNAWLAIMGFSAPEGISPSDYGKKKMLRLKAMLDAGMSSREQLRGLLDDGLDKLEFKGMTPFIHDKKEGGMLRYALRHNKEIRALERDNKELLRRYESLRDYPGYAEPIDYGSYAPMPLLSPILETQKLRLLLSADNARNGNYAAALSGLREDTEFWRFISGNSRQFITKFLSIACLHQNIRLAAEFGANLPLSDKERKILSDILRPFDKGETAMRESFRGEFRYTQKSMEMAYPTGQRTIEGIFYKRNATDNLFYQYWANFITLDELSPQQFAVEARKTANVNGVREKIGLRFLYNPVGEILALIGKGSISGYIEKGHDMEGLRRLALLKILIRSEKILPVQIQKYIDSHKADLGNPYTGEPMKWDPDQQALYFDKLSGRGRVEMFL